jgi:putative ABC transport system permease protein
MQQTGYQMAFFLQPLPAIHTKSDYDYEMAGNGNLTYLPYLGIAAIFILLIAWINYINLSTAHALDRSKEVGLRKVVGAFRNQLIGQFLAESLLLGIAALAIGICLFNFFLSPFSRLIQKEIRQVPGSLLGFWLPAAFIFLTGTLLAALYPAIRLSAFKPVDSIKGSRKTTGMQGSHNVLRKSLVVLQFSAAILLISGAIGFYRQLQYMQTRELGIDIRQTLVLQQTASQDSSHIGSILAFLNDLRANPSVKSVTASTSVPGSEVGASSAFTLQNSTAEKRCRILGIDSLFIPSYDLHMIAGRNISTDRLPADTTSMLNIIVNETAARVFGFARPSDIVGRKINGSGFHCMVIGVVRDYHQESLQHSFDPIIFYPEQETGFENFSLKLQTKNLQTLMADIKGKWTTYFQESPFRFFFAYEQFNNQYRNDRMFSTILWLFTALAITIACLGMLGLSLYTLTRRKKEISIRKLLGATVVQVTLLITREYLKLICLAGALALPITYLLVQNWLNNYAFHIRLGSWFFLLPLAVILFIGLMTVLFQSVRAAWANPSVSLRSE